MGHHKVPNVALAILFFLKQNTTERYRSGHNEAVLKTVWVKAHGGSNPSSSANKTDKPFACPFCLMHYVRGIRTRALRKRHSASFLAAARRLLQSIKTADQGCFAKDKNESLFLRHKNPTNFVGFFVASEE